MPANLTNNEIDNRLCSFLIKRLDDYTDIYTKILVQCLVPLCNYIWMALPKDIVYGYRGCPKCANCLKLSNEEVDRRISHLPIKRIDDYINRHTPITFQCLRDTCFYFWKAAPKHIMSENSGCPKCSKKVKYTNESIDELIKHRNIKRLDDYIKNTTPIRFQCTIDMCNYIWKVRPSHIIIDESGCPKCSSGKNEKLLYSILTLYNVDFLYHETFFFNERKLIVDFYIPYINCIIEYNGAQHYEPVCFGGISKEQAIKNLKKQQNRDNDLIRMCDINHIKLISIDGRLYFNSKLKIFAENILLPIIK